MPAYRLTAAINNPDTPSHEAGLRLSDLPLESRRHDSSNSAPAWQFPKSFLALCANACSITLFNSSRVIDVQLFCQRICTIYRQVPG